jgi:hypothetical protein
LGGVLGVLVFLFILTLAGDFHFFQVAAGTVVGVVAYRGLKRDT